MKDTGHHPRTVQSDAISLTEPLFLLGDGSSCKPSGIWITRADQESFAPRNLNALAMTDTLLKLIAAAAIIGLRRVPKTG